ncbi:MAG: pyridoxal-phosphate dependent enzyme [Vicinamibacterales bacterium]
MATALASLMSLQAARLTSHRSPIDRLTRLEAFLGKGCPRLHIKRDDLLGFGGGGNKVRKLDVLVSDALRAGADTLITCGAQQSNHARVTAAAGSVSGLRVILVLNGDRPERPTGNLKLDALFGAEVHLVASRQLRDAAMEAVAADVRAADGTPYVIPVGGSTALGAMGFARGVAEVSAAGLRPRLIVHASSSGGTQAGLIAGCALLGLDSQVVGVSADEPSGALTARVSVLLDEIASRLGARRDSIAGPHPIDVDDRHVGEGYGISTAEAQEATLLLARREGIILDPVYTAKAMAGLIARIRSGSIPPDADVLFWHTGGLHDQ